MDNKARYTLVGFFILTFSIAMVAFVLWLARYDVNKDSLKEYRLYVKQSIAGLNINSIVYYKGLDVGIVEDIRINSQNLEEIEIVLKLSKPELVKVNTVASIESQGVTGNKTIELSGGTKEASILQPKDDGYAVIPVKQSFFSELTSQASNIGQKVDIVLSQVAKVLSEKNLNNFEQILNNSNNSTKNLDLLINDLNSMVKNINTLVKDDVKTSLQSFDALLNNNIKQTLQKLDMVSGNVNELIEKDIKIILDDFKTTAKSAQNIDEVLYGFEQTLENINDTMDNFNQNGGDMLFKTRETKFGPGETR